MMTSEIYIKIDSAGADRYTVQRLICDQLSARLLGSTRLTTSDGQVTVESHFALEGTEDEFIEVRRTVRRLSRGKPRFKVLECFSVVGLGRYLQWPSELD